MRKGATRAENDIFRNSFYSEPLCVLSIFLFLHFIVFPLPVHEISRPCNVSKVVKRSIENWTSCFQLLRARTYCQLISTSFPRKVEKMAVQTALQSLRLAPIEAYFMSKSVSLFSSRSRPNGRRRADKVTDIIGCPECAIFHESVDFSSVSSDVSVSISVAGLICWMS